MKIGTTLGLLCSCLASAAWANDAPPIPIGEQLSEADLAIVGRLGAAATCEVEQVPTQCAELVTDAVLKGSREGPGQRRYVLLSSAIGEDRIAGLLIPRDALIFLRRRDGEVYEPLYGMRSVFVLSVYGELR